MIDALDLGIEVEDEDDGLTWEDFDESSKVLPDKTKNNAVVSSPAMTR